VGNSRSKNPKSSEQRKLEPAPSLACGRVPDAPRGAGTPGAYLVEVPLRSNGRQGKLLDKEGKMLGGEEAQGVWEARRSRSGRYGR
jgi:hypothetical protein